MSIGYFSRDPFNPEEWIKYNRLYEILASTLHEQETLANNRTNLENFNSRIDCFVKESIKKWEVEIEIGERIATKSYKDALSQIKKLIISDLKGLSHDMCSDMQIAAFKVNEIIKEKTENLKNLLNQAIVKRRTKFLETFEVKISAEKIIKERIVDFSGPLLDKFTERSKLLCNNYSGNEQKIPTYVRCFDFEMDFRENFCTFLETMLSSKAEQLLQFRLKREPKLIKYRDEILKKIMDEYFQEKITRIDQLNALVERIIASIKGVSFDFEEVNGEDIAELD